VDAGLLNPLLAHFDLDQVLRDEDFFHKGQILKDICNFTQIWN
jgi:hypothetical protein